MLEIGDIQGGYKHLKKCDLRRDIDGETLYLLADILQNHRVQGLSKKDARKKALWLMHLAAIKGEVRALIEITRLYHNGDSGLGVNRNVDRYNCLASVAHSAAGHGNYDRQDLLACI